MFDNRGFQSASLLLILLFHSFAVGASAAVVPQDERVEVRASETEQLRALLANQKVNAVLNDGTRIKGKVKEVRTGVIVLSVESSEGAAALPRGEQTGTIDRFSTLEITSYKGKKRGILAAALGAAGLALGLAIGGMEIDSLGGEGEINGAGVAVIVAAGAGGAAIGYLWEKLDKKRITIVIVK